MSKKENTQETLTKGQVWDVIEFAQNLYSMGNSFGWFTPGILNSNLQALNNTPQTPTYDNITKALLEYNYDDTMLKSFAQTMERIDMIYRRTEEYYANLLSFDLQITCKNARGADYQSAAYKQDKERVYKFLNNFNYKEEFRKVVKHLIRNETYHTWLRYNNNNATPRYALQLMPQDYFIITGMWEGGLLADFDMGYFLRAGTSVDLFAPWFKSAFNRVFGGKGIEEYIPSNQFDNRKGTYIYWTQTSPADGQWTFKFDMTNMNATPFLAALMKDAVLNPEIQKLQYNKDIIASYALLVGEMRMMKDQKSGNVKDAFAIQPATLGKFMNLVQKGLSGLNVKAIAMPTEEVEWRQFTDSNTDMYATQLKSTAAQGAGASRVIYSTDRQNQAELEAAIIADYNIVKSIYAQFNNFLDYFVNKKTKKYKFRFTFDGCTQLFEREKRIKRITELANVGIVLNSSAWASAIGMTPMDFEYSMDEAHNDGNFLANMSQLTSIHTQSASAGRPPSEEVSSKTIDNRDSM